jgi:3-hydroxypropanoate dehydrogenase
MADAVQPAVLEQLFRGARTYNDWSTREVGEQLIRELYDVLKWAPTSANTSPARFVWVRSAAAKAQLASLAMDMNRQKILAAPVTVIVGNDLDFPQTLPKLAPGRSEMLQQMFQQPGLAESTAFRNGSLQGAYLIIAARALGLDCGPMSGFDNTAVDRAFFAGSRIQSNFICSLGYGKPESAYPRSPRLSFDEAGRFA